MIEAYLDESADGFRADVIAIAAFVGTDQTWSEFSLKWFDVTAGAPDFHMTDCEVGGGDFTEKKGWPKERRVALITSAIDTMEQSNILGFGSVVMVEDFQTVFRGAPKELIEYLCFHQCVAEVTNWARVANHVIRFVFHQRPMFESRARSMYEEIRKNKSWYNRLYLGPLTFRSDRDFPPLKAADIAAYEAYKHCFNKRKKPALPTRKPLKRLIDAGRFNLYRWTLPYLVELGKQVDDHDGLLAYLSGPIRNAVVPSPENAP